VFCVINFLLPWVAVAFQSEPPAGTDSQGRNEKKKKGRKEKKKEKADTYLTSSVVQNTK